MSESTQVGGHRSVLGAPVPPRRPGRDLAYTGLEVIGRGRSGVVHRGRDGDGRELACKVFDSHGLTKLVQWIFLGAPNPYAWSEDAVRCAVLRRRILARLVPHHLPALRVADERGCAWNEDFAAFELATQFVRGRPARLDHPLRAPSERDEIRELAREVMEPLAELLEAAGCDGLVWQAGRGNPVAANNFLRVEGEGSVRWAWIDLESGVPALFALDPRALFGWYLPRVWRWGRPLFDDVDTTRLEAFLTAGATRFEPAGELARLRAWTAELDRHQRAWKEQPRHRRSIAYRLARGTIDAETAARYAQRPWAWQTRELGRALRRGPRAIGRRLAVAGARLAAVHWTRLARRLTAFLTSQRFRSALARRYCEGRLVAWHVRGQLATEHAERLGAQVGREETGAWLCDFGVHLAIKPFVKAFEYWLVPSLFAFGVVGPTTLAIVLLTAGATARSIYTAGRLIQAWRAGRERPWVALWVGTLPVVGNFAYPLQIVWSSTADEDDLARFLLYDGFARVGAHVPIWGGQDTHTEHALNRFGGRLLARFVAWRRRRSRLAVGRRAESGAGSKLDARARDGARGGRGDGTRTHDS